MAKKNKRAEQPPETVTPVATSVDSLQGLQSFRRYWLFIFQIWGGFVAIELCFQLFITGTAWRNPELPLGARLAIVSYGLAVLSAFVFTAAALLIPMVKSARRALSAALLKLAIVVSVWFSSLIYFSSWAKFWHTGRFLSYLDLAFIAPHPIQVFHWIEADVVLSVLAASVMVTFVAGHLLPRRIIQSNPQRKGRFAFAPLTATGIFIFGAIIGELYSGLEGRQWTRSGMLYASSRDQQGGPFAFLFAGARKSATRQHGIASTHNLQIIPKPIIPMEQYVAGLEGRLGKRWNVIILMVESLGANQLRDYGSAREVMPNVEALARESRVFLNTYTQASHTDYATLVPLSSHYPLRSGTAQDYPRNPTYPRVLIYDVLKAIRYRTAIFSSSNEYWAGMINYLQTGNLDRFFHAAKFKGPTNAPADDTGFAAWVKETKHAGSVDDRFTVAEAIAWLDTRNNEPFFLYLNLQNSHLPYIVPAEFPRRFSSEKIDFPIRFGHIPPDRVGQVKNAYADSLAYVDAQIGRFFDHLRRRGLWDRTIIVLSGDHGQAFNEHGFSAHAGAIYNEVMKVPLIIRAPGLKAGIDHRLAQHVDVSPSIMDLLGLPPHPSFQGVSLYDQVGHSNRSVYLVAQSPQAHQIGLVRDRHKLIYDEWLDRYELYDLLSDPAEKQNLAFERPALVKDLGARLQAWRKLQIDYYADRLLHSREYPPVLKE